MRLFLLACLLFRKSAPVRLANSASWPLGLARRHERCRQRLSVGDWLSDWPSDEVEPGEPRLLFSDTIARGAPCLIPAIRSVSADQDTLSTLQASYEQLLDVTYYLRPSAQQVVRLALEVALCAHHGQTRRSGEPYIVHPVEVACILAQSQMEKVTLISGLLHDTVEDTDLTFHEIERLFGSTVRKIVEGETKVSKLPKMVRSQMEQRDAGSPAETQSKLEEQVENLRSMFIAMADDWRIVVVKLADRLHNMRTLQYMPVDKRDRIARETLEIFSPLAHRLGMWQYKTELADLSFKYLFPVEYAQLDSRISSKFCAYENALEEAKQKIEDLVQTDPWLQGRLRSVHVVGRTKSIYSTFKKMQRDECSIEKILDLVALRVVLCPEPEERHDGAEAPQQLPDDSENAMCYHVLGKVHSCWTPLPRTLKDYISSPKPNGYRSLHTTVLVGTQPLEVQIRTQAMHLVAEYGAAAHWAYKDQAASLPWLQIIREWNVQVDSAHEFMQLVRQELLGTRVFVFTRNGRILNLARGATLSDAAIHLGVSLRGHVPLLNGAHSAPAQELSNGDIVSFEQSSPVMVPGPSASGAFLPATSATAASATAASGIAASSVGEGNDPSSFNGWDTTLGEGGIIQERAKRYLARRKRHVGWQLCTDCEPLPGDAILATIDVAHGDPHPHPSAVSAGVVGGVIHADPNCPTFHLEVQSGAMRVVDAQLHSDVLHAAMVDQLSSRADGTISREMGFRTSISVFCTDRRGMLMDVATVVTAEASNIINVHSEIFDSGGESVFRYAVTVQNRAQLESLIAALERVPDVSRVERGKRIHRRIRPK